MWKCSSSKALTGVLPKGKVAASILPAFRSRGLATVVEGIQKVSFQISVEYYYTHLIKR